MIDIVLATYNGERFLAEQIQSIQACIDYHALVSRLIIVDDGSTDNTLNLVTQLAKHDQRIELHLNESGLHGPSHNFAYGLTKTSANYLMLCDQDDIWFPEKISVSIQRLKQSENRLPSQTPILVFSDKQIVDENLQHIYDSYFSLKHISKDWHRTFKQLCQQNVVSGCTTLFNRALMGKALPIPEQAYMHDWWLALVAHRCGELVFIDKALIQYRQHRYNTIGASERSVISLFLKFTHHLRQFKKSQQGIINQAIAFKQFEQKNKLSENETLTILSSLNDATLCKKMSYFCKGKVTRSHFFGKVALLISLLDSKKQK